MGPLFKPIKVLKHLENYVLINVLRELSGKDSLLDLLFVNRDGVVGEVMISDYPGHNDDEIFELKFFVNMRKTVGRGVTLDFRRTGFRLLKELISKIPMESALESIWVHECWSLFKSHLLKEHRRRQFQLFRSQGGRAEGWFG